jgi:hypothetical protein
MAIPIREIKVDHNGADLPKDVFACARKDSGEVVSYKVRWREEDEDGIERHPSKSFSVRKHGSPDRALEAATSFLAGARQAVRLDGSLARPDTAGAMTIEELFQEWVVNRGVEIQEATAEGVVRLWDREIATRSIARVRLDRLSQDASILTRFQDTLRSEGMGPSKRREILKWLRAVLRWGRHRHPNAITVELSGLFQLPKVKRTRLAYAADAIGVERIIEAILKRPARDDLLPLRDAAFVAALSYTVASRPSEWRQSVTWDDLFEPSQDTGIGTVELQQTNLDGDIEVVSGLKTGAHVALLLQNAWDRIQVYRRALEDRFGPQPGDGLVFQVLGEDGPAWAKPDGGRDLVPLAMSKNDYNRWTARVWRPARTIAAQAPDAPAGLGQMTFYDCRHTAISLALHSNLVVGPHGMNLHPLAQWAGHDIQTLQRHYAHMIARYYGQPPINIVAEGKRAHTAVEAAPFDPDEQAAPQREAQRGRRKRAAAERRRQVRKRRQRGAHEPVHARITG